MSAHACRSCGAAISGHDADCPHCGCRAPFQCTVCFKPISTASLSVARNAKHPFGGYSRDGDPLCPNHWLTRCYRCTELFPRSEMTRKVVGKHADTNLRENMRPRIEDVHGAFCPACATGESKRADKPQAAPRYGWVVLAVMLACCFFLPWVLLTTLRSH